jgi:hypothetical protein
MKITVPHTVAGRNKIHYDRQSETFTWSIELDDGQQIEVLRSISPGFFEDLRAIIEVGLKERHSFIHKSKEDSTSVPSKLLRR